MCKFKPKHFCLNTHRLESESNTESVAWYNTSFASFTPILLLLVLVFTQLGY